LLKCLDLHVGLKNEGGSEELDAMMDGQSHRAKLREVVGNSMDQRYDPHGNDDALCRTSGAYTTRGSGVSGTRGRGATNQHRRSVIPYAQRTLGDKLTVSTSPIAAGNVISCPLDPAIDPNDPRSKYSCGRWSGQNTGGSKQANRSPEHRFKRSAIGLGRGGTAQDVRARTVGTTVQVAASSTRLPQARQLATLSKRAPASLPANHNPGKSATTPEPPARVPPGLKNSDDMLDPSRFLAALAATKDRETFDKMVSCQPKPAPASRAADIVAKPSKKVKMKLHELIQSRPRSPLLSKGVNTISSLGLEKPETEKLRPNEPAFNIPTHAKRTPERPKLRIPNAKIIAEHDWQSKDIRQVPTNEIVFPPPNSRSTKLSGDVVDAYTDGVLTPGTPNFSTSTEDGPTDESANVVQERNDGEATNRSSATTEATTPVVGLAIRVEPTPILQSNANADEDLLILGSEEVVDHGSSMSIAQSIQVHGAAANLMDLDFDHISHESLAPMLPKPFDERKSVLMVQPVAPLETTVERPASVVIGGIRYYREDQVPCVIASEAREDRTATIPATTDRLITGSGYTIGVRHLGPHNRDILGDRNVARRVEESIGLPEIDSIWAIPHQGAVDRRLVRDTSPIRIDRQPVLETLVDSHLSMDPRPSVIGGRNLARRSQPTPQNTLTPFAKGSPQAEDCNKPGFARCPQGASMSRQANPWSTDRSAASTEPRADDSTRSKWSKANARNSIGLSPDRSDEPRGTGLIIRSSESIPFRLSGDSLFSTGGDLGSNRNDFHSHTCENMALPSLKPTRAAKEQQTVPTRPTLSENFGLADSSQSPTQKETLSELMVRLTKSTGSTGLTPRLVDCRANESCESRDSASCAGNSRESSRSAFTALKPAMNLNTSKWAAEVPAISSTTKIFTAKSAKAKSNVPSVQGSNTQPTQRDGEIRTTITRTNTGPGFALLVADAVAAAGSSKSSSTNADTSVASSMALTGNAVEPPLSSASQAAIPNTCKSLTASVADAKTAAVYPSTRHSLGIRSNPARPIITSEPRVRVINQRKPLSQGFALETVRRGGESLQERRDDQDGSDSEGLEL
jgi:hypothetical protein